jgi:hypothetical protein
MDKTQFFPIQCNQVDLYFLNHSISSFSCTYLGLPLHIKKLPKSLFQRVIQKVANRMPGWKKILFTYSGREMLVKIVLSAMPNFFLTLFKMPKWVFAQIDRFMRSFLWKGQDPEHVREGGLGILFEAKKVRGLDIKDLEKFSRALRLKWL